MKQHQNLKGSLILGLASLIWGMAFVAQSDAATKVPPFLVNGTRSLIGALALFLLLLFQCKKSHQPLFPKDPDARRQTLIGGLVCGVLITVSCNLQQFGLSIYPDGVASEARAGFLTAMYVILVPVISLFMGKKLRLPLICAILISARGIYLLCLSGGLDAIYLGDVLIFLCAISFAFHILAIDRYVGAAGGVRLSMLQFLVCGVLSSLLSFCFEPTQIVWKDLLSAMPQLLYLGIGSTGIAYTLQIVGQKYAEPTVASLTMSLESVFAALGGWLISGNTLTLRELGGCALVFVAIVLAQLPEKKNANFPTKKKTDSSPIP